MLTLIPEPGTAGLLGLGLLAIAARRGTGVAAHSGVEEREAHRDLDHSVDEGQRRGGFDGV